ncbi:chromate transporter [Treponema zioleckii]|uniref:chromate transporter n=1 Tax=Treponema zioleckii TaxID=331680 RepID=UPI0030EF1738
MTDFLISEIQSQSAMGLLCLVAVFFYVGLITIGGGQVGITIMQQTLVENFHLLGNSDFYNMVAISESTPGPIGINVATYIGTELYGVFGGFVSTLGEVLPSLICIMIIAKFFGKFAEKKGVKAAFSTLRPAVSGVIAVAAAKIIILALFAFLPGFDLYTPSTWHETFYISGTSFMFYLLCLLVLFKTKLHPVFIVLGGAVFGVLFF